MYVQNTDKLDAVRQEVHFASLDGTMLTGWWMPARKGKVNGKSKGTIVQFHGNAQNLTSHFMILFWLTEQGYDLFSFDYRGFGISKGSPSQEGLDLDAQAAIRYALARTEPGPSVTLYGQSLGGAVLLHALGALSAAERARIHAVVIESSFHNYKAIARDVLSRSWISYLLQPLAYVLVSNSTSPEDFIAQVSPIPLLVMHGDRDAVVPIEFGKRIFELAREPKRFYLIEGGGHLEAPPTAAASARRALLDFLADPLPKK
jgi:fermentation-respiration switch protein FrsA (DUF1100 family)